MTKNKTRKMTKSTFAVIIMGICLVALLAFGGTYAYFTASTSVSKSDAITTGHVKLKQDAKLVTTELTDIVPGKSLTSGPITITPDVKGTGEYIAVRIILEIQKANTTNWVDASTFLHLTGEGGQLDSAKWTYDATNKMYVYGTADKLTDVTANTAIQFTKGALKFDVDDHSVDGAPSADGFMDAKIRISIQSVAIQSKTGDKAVIDDATARPLLEAKLEDNPFATTPAGT